MIAGGQRPGRGVLAESFPVRLRKLPENLVRLPLVVDIVRHMPEFRVQRGPPQLGQLPAKCAFDQIIPAPGEAFLDDLSTAAKSRTAMPGPRGLSCMQIEQTDFWHLSER